MYTNYVRANTVVHTSKGREEGLFVQKDGPLIYVPLFHTGMHFKLVELNERNDFKAGSPKKVIFTLDTVHLGGPVGLWFL